MGSIAEFFQGRVPPSVTSTVQGTESLPAWLQEIVRGTALNAIGVAQEPYRPSPVPQVAGFTPDQQQAFQRIRDFQGAYRPYFDQSAALVSGATSPFDRQQLAKYESPYIQGVANRSTELATRNLLQNVLPNINSTFTGSGQFGSSRHADFTNRAIRDATSELQGNLAGIHQQGLNEAYNQYNLGRNRLLQGATQFSDLGRNLQAAGYQDIGALSGAGETQQALNQQNLSTAYKDFIEQREYPKEQLNFLQSIIRGLPYNRTTTSSSTAPYQGGLGASPLSQILGGISTGVGLGKLFGFAEGGQVTAKKLNQAKRGKGYQEGGLAEEDQEAFADPNIPTDDAYGEEGPGNGTSAPASQSYTDVNDDVLQQLNQYQQQSQRTALAQLQQARQQALSALQPQQTNDAGLFFALAQGFNAPTTTGSFGESFGNVGKALAPYAEQRAADEQAYRRAQAQYGLQSAEDAYKAAQSPLKFHNVGDKTYADVGGRLVSLGSRRPGDIKAEILKQATNPKTGEVDLGLHARLLRDAGLAKQPGSGGDKQTLSDLKLSLVQRKLRGETLTPDELKIAGLADKDSSSSVIGTYQAESLKDLGKASGEIAAKERAANELASAVENFGDESFSGPLAGLQKSTSEFLGIDPQRTTASAAIDAGLANFQLFKAPGSGPLTENDARKLEAAIPKLRDSPQGKRLLAKLFKASTRFDRQVHNITVAYQSGKYGELFSPEAEEKRNAEMEKAYSEHKKLIDEANEYAPKQSQPSGSVDLKGRGGIDLSKAQDEAIGPDGKTVYYVDGRWYDDSGQPIGE